MELENIETNAVTAAVLAACNQPTRLVGNGIPAVILPSDFSVENLEHTLAAPTRKRGTANLLDSASFVAVVNDQKNDDTRLFSTTNPPTFTAVFNHHAQEAGWGDHRATYNAPLSVEWKTWTGVDGDKMTQTEMAQFLEANLVDVRCFAPVPASDGKPAHPGSPDGTTLLEICRTLEATKKVDFKSSVRLSDGTTQFTYNEEVQGSAQQGQLTIPEQFTVGIPVFENGAPYRVDVRLRYRIDSGRLVFWMELVRTHKVMEHAVDELRTNIAKETGLQILNGTPSK